MTRDNNLLGNIEVNGIPRLPREPQVEVMFDANGILQVSVLNKATSKPKGRSFESTFLQNLQQYQLLCQYNAKVISCSSSYFSFKRVT